MSGAAARSWRLAGVVLLAVLAVDQLTKVLVRRGVEQGSSDPIFPLLKLVHVENRGVAFGAFAGGGQTVVIIVIAIALGGLLAYFATHAHQPGVWLPTGLLVGGAVGNIIDRVALGAVTDFLKLPSWPAFNVADMAITCGVIALIAVVEMSDRRRDEEPIEADGAAGPV
ncbi:signal peptidase II [Conexibacter sp. W3-3-2]|uniref:Lipoprotein signal peptidase n=1 Tax=Paraconexibacter algicola TaxID=2133960 RepID=A0A2T4UBG8_9ACTN|nr:MULTISPECIES: signal peptidase II [Solirubrobacterales]MTD43323.1 signal peptidase II [Conexibacter sp. W3-3-2]PTL54195.1 signal peptidase II [Paraconexibacter algicola]